MMTVQSFTVLARLKAWVKDRLMPLKLAARMALTVICLISVSA